MLGAITTGMLIGMLAVGKVEPSLVIDSGLTFQVEATAYCNPHNRKTASGKRTVEGLTIAGCEEWLGTTCYIWNEDMTEFWGIYEFTDLGGDYRLQNGTCIDIFFEDKNECLEFGRQNVTIQVVRGKG